MFHEINKRMQKEIKEKVDLTKLPVSDEPMVNSRIVIVMRDPVPFLRDVLPASVENIQVIPAGGCSNVIINGELPRSDFAVIVDYCLDSMGGNVQGFNVGDPVVDVEGLEAQRQALIESMVGQVTAPGRPQRQDQRPRSQPWGAAVTGICTPSRLSPMSMTGVGEIPDWIQRQASGEPRNAWRAAEFRAEGIERVITPEQRIALAESVSNGMEFPAVIDGR